jgi:uncharacterized membrane protein YbhN (UPF0104 family)
MAGGAQNVNPMRFDLRFSAIAFGCLLALLKDLYPARLAAKPPSWAAIPILGLLALAVSQIVPHAGMVVGIVEGTTVAALQPRGEYALELLGMEADRVDRDDFLQPLSMAANVL